MLKKLSCLLLALALLLSFAACGSKEPAATEPTAVPESLPTEAPYIFDIVELVNNENIIFTVTDYIPGEVEETLLITAHNLMDTELTLSIQNLSVNDVMYPDLEFSLLLPSEDAVAETFAISWNELQKMGITKVTKLEFTLYVTDAEDFSADPVLDQVLTLYPYGEEAVESYARPEYYEETVAADNDNCTIIVLNCGSADDGGYQALVYLQNKTDKTLSFFVDNAKLSGKDCDPLWSVDVAPGKHAVSVIHWEEGDLGRAGVTAVNSILLELRVIDADNWLSSPILKTDVEIRTN